MRDISFNFMCVHVRRRQARKMRACARTSAKGGERRKEGLSVVSPSYKKCYTYCIFATLTSARARLCASRVLPRICCHLGASCGHLGAFGGYHGLNLGLLGVILGPLGVILGPSWAFLVSSWGLLRSSWAFSVSVWGTLGASWGHPWPSFGPLGALLGPFGPS